MKLPRFLRIDPDFKRAVDVFPNKEGIRTLHLCPDVLFFGDDPYFDPTWAELRYARKARSKYLSQRDKRIAAENAVCRPIENRALLAKILSGR